MADLECPIARWAREIPMAPAVISGLREYSYREYHLTAAIAAAHFRDEGSTSTDAIATLLPNSVELIFTLMGLIRAGRVVCPMNPRWPDQHITRLLSVIECRNVVTQSDMAFSVGDAPVLCHTHVPPDRPASVTFTSGSTGEPKAAVHMYGNHYFSAMAANRNMPLKPGDRWLLSLPLYHVAGWGVLFRCALAGAAVVVPEEHESIEETIARHGVTHVSLVSTQLHRMLEIESGVAALSKLKGILLGGGPMPPPLIRHAFEARLPIHTSYGLTETASQVTATRPRDGLDALLTSGWPLEPGTVSVGTDGQILVRGETLFLGYLRNGKTEPAVDADGWFATGDLGSFDSEGRLRVTGRKDNAFVCGGENIQPEEIECHLCEIPAVVDAVVVPVENPEYGHIPVAFIQGEGQITSDPARLAKFLQDRLPRHKIPRHFLPWPEGANIPSAKINRTIFSNLALTALSSKPFQKNVTN